MLESGENQRNAGIWFIIVAVMFLGTALFSTLIHIKNNKILWTLGSVILCAGVYIVYSAESIAFWSESVFSNTTVLGCSMMFYMLFLSVALVHFLKSTKKAGTVTVAALMLCDVIFLLLPVLTDIFFYDTWFCWVAVQMLVNLVLLGCLVKEMLTEKGKQRWLYIGSVLPLAAFAVDTVMIGLGLWSTGNASKCVFVLIFVVATVAVLKIIPHGINALAKTQELETEKILLNAQLTESRVSTMMSQIRPHFIYNTLGSIEQLCVLDPPKAGELVHNFAKYLRGNFGELDNHKPILMSQEMEHVRHYISIENVRFPDMTFPYP